MMINSKIIASALTTLLMVGSAAQAGPHDDRYHHLDDLAFAAFVDARELRWEIHDDFVDSHDYDHLLSDADEVVRGLQSLQASIYRERPDQLLARDVVTVQRNLSNLTQHLNASDFAHVDRGSRRSTYNGRGYVFTPETQHVGRVHVVAALRLINRIEHALEGLERAVNPRGHGHHHSSQEPITLPDAPAPGGPVLLPRESRSRGESRTVEVPLGNDRNGVILRFGF